MAILRSAAFQELIVLEKPASNPPSGTVNIPGYDLLETIGEGGMGVVCRATQHNPRRTVARLSNANHA
jgi:hypothetical protein